MACELHFHFVSRDAAGRVVPALPRRIGRAPGGARVPGFDKLDEWADLLAYIDAACALRDVPAGAATAEYGKRCSK